MDAADEQAGTSSPGTQPRWAASEQSQGFVDYDQVAERYHHGRSLPADVLDRWGEVVARYVPLGPLRVVDVGAGTGIFARAWAGWMPAQVAAVEPSAAMIGAGRREEPGTRFVQAVAETLPLRDACADAVWISTALHHVADTNRAVDEIGRVLKPSGRVLVRTYVPGRTEITWVQEFPGRSKWEARFHSADELVALFAAHGLRLVEACDVLEATETYDASAAWISRMRNADSLLTALSDGEVAAGLDALRSRPTKVGRLELSLFVFEPLTFPGRDRPTASSESGSTA